MEKVSIDKVIEALKMRDVEEEDIKDFLSDLFDKKEIEQDDDFYYLDKDTLSKLKSTQEGKALIRKAPTMERKELIEKVKQLLKE